MRLSAAILGARRSSWTEFGVDAGEAAVALGDAVFMGGYYSVDEWNEHTTKEGEKNGEERRVACSGVAGGGARPGLKGGKKQEGVPLVEWGAEEEVIDALRTMRSALHSTCLHLVPIPLGHCRGAVKEPALNTPYGALKKKDIKGFASHMPNVFEPSSKKPNKLGIDGAHTSRCLWCCQADGSRQRFLGEITHG
ncbi:hypothetical protein B0H14DRAFT_2587685 [Mycena olivaceomarginata]|nr:hypothetical protein B0H14DRAFT_2587685 [Mycena olivaceomarginata]